jgi:hypothetical protein
MIVATSGVFNRCSRRYHFPSMLSQDSTNVCPSQQRSHRGERRDRGVLILKAYFLCALCLLCGEIAFPQPANGDTNSTTSLHSSDGQYQLVLGKGWTPYDFHLDAVQIGAIQKARGEYVEVIVENQSDYTNSLGAYARAKRDTMAISLDNPKLTSGQYSPINGHDAISFEIHGQLPGTNTSVGYTLTVIKTKTHYVQVIGWTQESHFTDNVNDLQALAGGFSETPTSGN